MTTHVDSAIVRTPAFIMSDSLSSQFASATISATEVAPSSSASSSSSSSRAHLPPLRVLTLGDGNFSFSAAIVQMHEGKRQRSKKTKLTDAKEASADIPAISSDASSASLSTASFQPSHRLLLTATSFDSAADLRAKYPEAARLCEKIIGGKKAKTNRVEHDVDATQLERTLRGKLAQQSSEAVSSALATSIPTSGAPIPLSPDEPFDVIIFNHPHSGREDLALHGSLLAHFFHSAKEFLREDDVAETRQKPQIHVTLCMKQPEDWELLQHAALQGFRLLSRSQFLESHYPSYETKRHHVNKTFARKTIERMELLIFERTASADKVSSSSSPPVYTQAVQDPSFVHNLLSHVLPLPAFHPTLPLEVLAKDSAVKDATKPILLTEWRCTTCDKGFTSERGLHYHMIDVHQSPDDNVTVVSTSSSSHSSTKSDLVCEECDPPRDFKTAEAMHQHILARHTAPVSAALAITASVDPSAVVSEQPITGENSAYGASLTFPCSICPMSFATASALELHLAGGVPPIVAASVECLGCGRVFSNHRALDQHARAMAISPEKHVRIDLSQVEGQTNAILGGATGKMKKLREMVAARHGQDQLPTSAVERLGVKIASGTAAPAAGQASTA